MVTSSVGAEKNSIVKTKKTRKKWKKPKDKPKRPLSAYNIFFRHERENLMLKVSQGQEKFAKVGFAALAKHIGAKWKQLDPEPRKIYEAQAEIEQQRYKVLLEEWRRKQKSGYGSSKDLLAPSPCSLLEKSKMPDLPSSSSCTKVSPNACRSNSLPLPKKERHAIQNKTLNARRSSMPLQRANQYVARDSSSLSSQAETEHNLPRRERNNTSNQNLTPIFVSLQEKSKKTPPKAHRSNSLPLTNKGRSCLPLQSGNCYVAQDNASCNPNIFTSRADFDDFKPTSVFRYLSNQDLTPFLIPPQEWIHSTHQVNNAVGNSAPSSNMAYNREMWQDHILHHGDTLSSHGDRCDHKNLKFYLPCEQTNNEPQSVEDSNASMFDFCLPPPILSSESGVNNFLPKTYSPMPDWDDEADLGELYQLLKFDTNFS